MNILKHPTPVHCGPQGEDVLKRLGELSGKLPVRIAVDLQKDKHPANLKFLTSAGQSLFLLP
jgi:hypothetical protein